MNEYREFIPSDKCWRSNLFGIDEIILRKWMIFLCVFSTLTIIVFISSHSSLVIILKFCTFFFCFYFWLGCMLATCGISFQPCLPNERQRYFIVVSLFCLFFTNYRQCALNSVQCKLTLTTNNKTQAEHFYQQREKGRQREWYEAYITKRQHDKHFFSGDV